MMEQSDSRKRHRHSIFITGFNYRIVSHGTAWLSNKLHTALMCSFNIVTEREECIRTKCDICKLIQPCTFFFSCKYFRFFSKSSLSFSISKHIHVFLADVNIDRIVSFCSADAILKWKVQHLRTLTEEPVISFLSRKSGTMYT